MPRGRKPKILNTNAVRTIENIDVEIDSVNAQIVDLKNKLTSLRKERFDIIAAKEQEELKLLGSKIKASGKTIEEWLKEFVE